MPNQERNLEHNLIHTPDLAGNGYEYVHEPIGDFGVWNGQFEIGPVGPWALCENWEAINVNFVVERVTGGFAGNWCIRGGGPGQNTGGDIISGKYIPVSVTRDYYIAAAMYSTTGAGQAFLGCRCYDAAKAYLGSVWPLNAAVIPAAWTMYQRIIGPTGDTAFSANTKYIRVVASLQTNAVPPAGEYVYIDDVQFRQIETLLPYLTIEDGLVVNESGIDADTRIESDGNANMLFVDAGNDRVGILTGTPSAKFDVYGATIRAQSNGWTPSRPTTGIGLELEYAGDTDAGIIRSYDRTGGAYKDLIIDGLTLRLNVSSGGSVTIGSAGVGDLWVGNNCSARSFTDRTRHFTGDALAAIRSISGNTAGIDHSTLPAFARARVQGPRGIEEGRDLGAMVSLLTVAVQQLLARVEKLEAA